MLRDTDREEVQVGQTVYLYPQTKQADADCYAQRVAEVISPLKAYWPKVHVQWDHPTESRKVSRLVHKDNIRLKPPSAAKSNEGDATTDHEVQHAQARPLGKPVVHELIDGEEQLGLW